MTSSHRDHSTYHLRRSLWTHRWRSSMTLRSMTIYWQCDQIGQFIAFWVTFWSPLWPDWAIFRHFGNSLKALVNFVMVYLVFGKNLNLLLQLFNANGPIITEVTGQILNKWSSHLVTLAVVLKINPTVMMQPIPKCQHSKKVWPSDKSSCTYLLLGTKELHELKCRLL